MVAFGNFSETLSTDRVSGSSYRATVGARLSFSERSVESEIGKNRGAETHCFSLDADP
ncbi:hypothetical protein LEP1GSC171_1379 [Leptospira santarosai str. HAI1380]|nr:hypothetical protein LEP1GSC171_1379 [Leptospira santarosai str. HAI1380]